MVLRLSLKTKFQIVSLDKIVSLSEASAKPNEGIYKVTPSILQAFGLIRKQSEPIKILKGKNDLKSPFHIEADAFSATAESMIKDSGGVVIKRVRGNKSEGIDNLQEGEHRR